MIYPSLLKWHIIGAQRLSPRRSSNLYLLDSPLGLSLNSDGLLNKFISKSGSFDRQYESDVDDHQIIIGYTSSQEYE